MTRDHFGYVVSRYAHPGARDTRIVSRVVVQSIGDNRSGWRNLHTLRDHFSHACITSSSVEVGTREKFPTLLRGLLVLTEEVGRPCVSHVTTLVMLA